MRKERDMKLMLNKLTVDSAVEWIDGLISAHERGVTELKHYRERFIESTKSHDTLATPVSVLSWIVNETQNVQRNLRLDMAANHAAALVASDINAK